MLISIKSLNVIQLKLYSNEYFELMEPMDTVQNYFTTLNVENICYTNGTNIEYSRLQNKCVCNEYYYGQDCGVPSYIWKTGHNAKLLPKIIRRRKNPRRVIYGFPVNHEFDLFETRMAMQADAVDAFVVHESNYTNSGKSKPLHFLHKLQDENWLREYHNKIIYIFQDTFPPGGLTDGRIADAYMRRNLGQTAFRKRLKGFKDDDLFVYNDGDELIRPEILMFLKLYEGFSDPVGFKYRWSIFGFFWTVRPKSKFYKYHDFESAAMTVGFFKDFYDYDASLIRGSAFQDNNDHNKKLKNIYKDHGKRIDLFHCSDDAGWHCSYCFKPDGIRKKLLDAPLSDWPRWGDDPQKTKINYIENLIKDGKNFDGTLLRGSSDDMLTPEKDLDFAPKYMLDHIQKYEYLLVNSYR